MHLQKFQHNLPQIQHKEIIENIGIDFGNLNGFAFGEPLYGFGSQRSTRSFNSLSPP